MGLNDIRLTAASLAELYPRSLVDMGDGNTGAPEPGEKPVTAATATADQAPPQPGLQPPVATDTAIQWKSLGNNRKKVLVVVDYPATSFLPDEELNFLTKMLTACKLGLDDVAIVNSAIYQGRTPADYQRHFGSLQVLLFGKDPDVFGLPMSFPLFQVQSFAGTAFLSAPALGTMMDDKEQKTALWTSLRRLFNL